MENPQRNPQRLSAMYQYHNAPEVAPAHGLEYDETVRSAFSDKYPVIHNNKNYEPPHSGKVFDNDRPPRIIFGMKIRTFLLVATLMVLVIIGAAVGGAVGGKGNEANTSAWPTNGENNDDGNNTDATDSNDNNSTNTSTSSSPPSATVSAAAGTYSGPTPTYQPLDSCPSANYTSYTSNYTRNLDISESSDTANLTFTLHCDLESPLSGNISDATTLSETFVYSLQDCIELCASLNFWAGTADCSFAAYEAKGSRPGNCWVGKAEGLTVEDMEEKDGVAVAVLGT